MGELFLCAFVLDWPFPSNPTSTIFPASWSLLLRLSAAGGPGCFGVRGCPAWAAFVVVAALGLFEGAGASGPATLRLLCCLVRPSACAPVLLRCVHQVSFLLPCYLSQPGGSLHCSGRIVFLLLCVRLVLRGCSCQYRIPPLKTKSGKPLLIRSDGYIVYNQLKGRIRGSY